MEKPYPFYDWVKQARDEIGDRPGVPVALAAEPSGAEYAEPLEALSPTESAIRNPDPDGQIASDTEGLIRVEVIGVPVNISPGGAARIHVIFRPNEALKVHWNNESMTCDCG